MNENKNFASEEVAQQSIRCARFHIMTNVWFGWNKWPTINSIVLSNLCGSDREKSEHSVRVICFVSVRNESNWWPGWIGFKDADTKCLAPTHEHISSAWPFGASHSFPLFLSLSVEYTSLHISVYVDGFMASNAKTTVSVSKLSNEKENHLWKIETEKKTKTQRKTRRRNAFAPSVPIYLTRSLLLSLVTCNSCNLLEAHTLISKAHP